MPKATQPLSMILTQAVWLQDSLTHSSAKGKNVTQAVGEGELTICWEPLNMGPSWHPTAGKARPYLHSDGDIDLSAEDRHTTVSHTHSQYNAAPQGRFDGLSVQGTQVSEDPFVRIHGEVLAVWARQQAEVQTAVVGIWLVTVMSLCRQAGLGHQPSGAPQPPQPPPL